MTYRDARRAPVQPAQPLKTKHRLASWRRSGLLLAKLVDGDVCAAYVGDFEFARCARCHAAWGFHPEATR